MRGRLNYLRYWVAEHHNMRGIASAATSLVISHIASNTKNSKGWCWGHHAAKSQSVNYCRVIWNFSNLHGNRIDWLRSRAGKDQNTMLALRRSGTRMSVNFQEM